MMMNSIQKPGRAMRCPEYRGCITTCYKIPFPQTFRKQNTLRLPSRVSIPRPRYYNSRSPRVHASNPSSGYGSAWLTPQDSYLTVGLAHCFSKGDDGKLTDRFVIEPISANQIEAMANGAKTCFKQAFGTTLQDALTLDKSQLPPDFATASYCDNFAARADACARTWLRPHALDNLLDIVPLGQMKTGYNFSIEEKRVLNVENIVTDDDNIKQDISIDVYGRNAKEEAAEKLAADGARYEAKSEAKEEEDELDALLA